MKEITVDDKLVVTGLGKGIDGEYPCDFASMLSIGESETLTNRELHRIKLMSGVRAGELQEALDAGDNDVLIALAAIILARHGKRVTDEQLWDAPGGSSFDLIVAAAEDVGDDSPPDLKLADEPKSSEPPSSNGGTSSPTISDTGPESDLSSIGSPSSETDTSVPASDPATSGT